MSGKFRLVRAVRRLLLTIAGIIGATGGVAWIIDHRRIRDDD
jgi:hypothetical protein